MILKSLFAAACLYLLPACLVQAAGYQPWSETVFAHIEQEYGPDAARRVRQIHGLALENQDKTVEEKLRLANDTMNNLPWIADKEHWDKADYWATPMETLATFGGDCEDIAIAKWIMLRHLGIPAEHLRLAHVKLKRTGESHMVLAYVERLDVPREQRTAMILDNLVEEVKPAAERTDLLAVFATDAQGNMVLFKDTGQERSIYGVHEKVKMESLEDLKKKIGQNMAKYQELNDGRPLLPQ